jgi:UDP-N-acetylglucosamine--N-acetylmuramyl-(pentapeptide) pyrophosphoryl-undecaprenol N-acetylglucosamine transferase
MAGGTGGHIYPALAVANCLRQRDVPTLWLGTKAGLEAKIVPGNGLKLLTINISGLRGKGIMRWITAPLSIFMAVIQSIVVLSQHKPAAVLGMGGFASGPGGIAAWLMRIPLCVHEQNAVGRCRFDQQTPGTIRQNCYGSLSEHFFLINACKYDR